MSVKDNNNTANPTNTLLESIRSAFSQLIGIWWIFLIVGFVGGLAGITYSLLTKAKYTSSATFALDGRDGGGLSNLLSLASQFGINPGGGSQNVFAGDNILEVMKSRKILEQVLTSVDTFNTKPYTLIQYYIDMEDDGKFNKKIQISFPVGTPHANYSYQQDSILFKYYNEFKENLIVVNRPDKKLSLFEVRVTTPNEKLTKVVTERLLDYTNVLYTNILSAKNKKTIEILEERAAHMKTGLDNSLEAKANIRDANINPVFEKADVPVLRKQSDIRIYGTAYGELIKNLEVARFQYLNELPLMQIIDKPEYPMKRIKPGKLKSAILFSFLSELILLLLLSIKYAFKR